MVKKKKRVYIILICIVVILYVFRYTIITDLKFLIDYQHFERVIEIIKRDYVKTEADISKIKIIDDVIIVDGNALERKELYMEAPELAEELAAIYGQSMYAKVLIYFDESKRLAVEFCLNSQDLKEPEKNMIYSIIYVEENFEGKETWMNIYKNSRTKSDYIGKKDWYRWWERINVG